MKKRLFPFVALQFRDFRLLLFATFLSQIGAQMQLVTVNWHMYTLTHSPIFLGYLGLAGFLPILAFSLVSGTLVDRFDRRLMYLISMVIVALGATLLAITTIFHVVSPTIIYIAVIFSSIAATISIPSRQSLLPSFIPKEHFVSGVSMSSMVWQAATVFGPMLGGFAIAVYGVQSSYIANALASLGTVVILIFLHSPKIQEQQHVPVDLKSIKEGISFVVHTPMIYSTMLLDFFATFFASATILMPIFAKDILSVGPQGVGLLYAAPAFGSLITALFLAVIPTPKKQGKFLLIGILLYGIATLCFGISRIFILSLVALIFSGIGDMVSAVIRNTIRQLETPDNLRGRMTAINMNFFVGGPYLGDVEAGVTASLWGAPTSVVVGGIGTVLLTFLVASLVPKLRTYKAEELTV